MYKLIGISIYHIGESTENIERRYISIHSYTAQYVNIYTKIKLVETRIFKNNDCVLSQVLKLISRNANYRSNTS